MMPVLYGTQGCHLCDEALAMLNSAGIQADHVDIANDDELSERYGMRIPVLQRMDGKELGWPFDPQALSNFLRAP